MLIRSLEKMIFDFTQAIAYAIDLKSDKSYQHVQNVAHLTNLLAREVNLVDQGALAHREFSRDELDEIAISGWLHDLGKIATPHNLLNKNTKLQKNCDRINHIKIKFDLVEQVIINQLASDLPANRKAELKKILEQLPADFELITQLNPGKEFVSDEIIEQLYRIANVKIEVNNSEYKLLDADELENLLIRRGTLTASEYEEVKQHAQLTSSILSNINFPGKFRNVPQIASSHHERINGSGYPLGLKENEISLQSRILAIADIFDALMSKRSYKQGYQLKTSLNILAKMAAANEIDKDLMDIILDRKIYLTFAGLYDGELSSDINTEDIKKIYRGN
jgi:response regulator RpfG family c-di-GMP phosphodiesterase